jgi:glycolate oxidase
VLRHRPYERTPKAAMDRAAAALGRAFGPSKLLVGVEACAAFGGDESLQPDVPPDAVVLAEDEDDVARALAVAAEGEVPITPRGAGTGKTGGAIPVAGGIVLATTGLRSIVEIDREELVAVVEPGVVLADFQAAVEAEGLFYGPDPNSLATCAIGGNLAENAGGPRAFKYGVTRDWVRGLEVVTIGGARLSTGRRTAKGVTGYDVTALLVGSEGTLAVTTRATLRLVAKPPAVATLLALFDDVRGAGRAVSAIIAAGLVPRCLELFDAPTLAAVRAKGVAVDARAGAMLLLEVDGDPVGCELAMERTGAVCADAGAIDVLAAQDAAQRDRLWDARRMLSHATRAMARFKVSEDVVVPRAKIPDLLADVDRIAEATRVRMLTYGHAGDGNLHVNLLWDDADDEPRVADALERLFRAVIALRGTLSGEHGIGLAKAEFLPLEQSDELIDLQRRLKAVFDPKGLLNPHKIFPRRTHGPC